MLFTRNNLIAHFKSARRNDNQISNRPVYLRLHYLGEEAKILLRDTIRKGISM